MPKWLIYPGYWEKAQGPEPLYGIVDAYTKKEAEQKAWKELKVPDPTRGVWAVPAKQQERARELER